MQSDLDRINEWCGANRLSINYEETKIMLFGNKNQIKITILDPVGDLVHINENPLVVVDHYKYLGINLTHLTHYKYMFKCV